VRKVVCVLFLLVFCTGYACKPEENPGVYTNRGLAYANKGLLDEAIAEYGKALAIDPSYALAYYNRGYAYGNKGQYDKAIEDYTRAIELNPGFAEAYTGRGVAYERKGQYGKSIDDHNRAIELNPNYAVAYYNRGAAYGRKHRYAEAIKDYTRSVELNPKFALAFASRGMVYRTLGQYGKAIQEFEVALRLNPTDQYTMLNLYLVLYESDQERQATIRIRDFKNALRTDEWPKAILEYFSGAGTEENIFNSAKTGDIRKERERMCDTYYYLGMFAVVHGDKSKAMKYFQECIDTGAKELPEYDLATVELDKLRNILH